MKYRSRAWSTAWKLVNKLWIGRGGTGLPTDIDNIMGCGFVSFTTNDKPDNRKYRLYRIIVSKTAYLIWKMRNKWWIRDDDGKERLNVEGETTTR